FATGVANVEPDVPEHDDAVRAGLIRYCPICDGMEVTGKRLAVLGCDERAPAEMDFLRAYSDKLDLIVACEGDQRQLEEQGHAAKLATALKPLVEQIEIAFAEGAARQYDAMYACLGVRPRTELARQIGVNLAAEETIETDKHQRTNVAGAYAAGDVVHAL